MFTLLLLLWSRLLSGLCLVRLLGHSLELFGYLLRLLGQLLCQQSKHLYKSRILWRRNRLLDLEWYVLYRGSSPWVCEALGVQRV